MNVDSTDEPRFAAYVAIDWGDSKHVWSLQPADSDRRERGEIEHSPEAVAAWAAMLSARFGGQPVALAVEQSRGPLVFMLGKYEQLHVYPIHPRATAQLKLYFPQMLDWFDAVDSPLVGALLKRWPTLETLQKARPDTVRSFFTAHNCRSQELIERRLDQIRQAVPAVRDKALIEAAQTMTKVLVELIATLR